MGRKRLWLNLLELLMSLPVAVLPEPFSKDIIATVNTITTDITHMAAPSKVLWRMGVFISLFFVNNNWVDEVSNESLLKLLINWVYRTDWFCSAPIILALFFTISKRSTWSLKWRKRHKLLKWMLLLDDIYKTKRRLLIWLVLLLREVSW